MKNRRYRSFYFVCALLALTGFAPSAFAVLPLDARIIERDLPQDMVPGGTYPITVTFKNTGYETWYPASSQCGGIRLGSALPRDNMTWGVGRVELPRVVAPGELARFDFFVRAPTTPGTYNIQWQMLKECVTWFGDYSFPFTVTVRAAPLPLDARFLSQSVPSRMAEPGGWYTASVTLRNTGTEPWNKTGPVCDAFRLGPHNPQDTTRWTLQRAELPVTVPVGATVTIRYTVRAPLAPGFYNFQWQMIKECRTWFGDLTPNVVVAVGPSPTPPPVTPTPTAPPPPTPPPLVPPGACRDICRPTSNCAQSCYVDTAQGAMWMTCGQNGWSCAR